MLNQNNLTELERKALKLIIKKLYAEYGFSDVIADDLQEPMGLPNKHSLSGVISSLSKKGYIEIEDYNSGYNKHEFIHLTAEGSRFHPEHSIEVGVEYEELN